MKCVDRGIECTYNNLTNQLTKEFLIPAVTCQTD
jgi:hypothetical protein